MKTWFQHLLNSALIYLIGALLFFGSSILAIKISNSAITLNKVTKKINKSVNILEGDFYDFLEDEDRINRLIADAYTSEDFNFLVKKPYTIVMYQEGNLRFWNNNKVNINESFWYEKYPAGVNYINIPDNGFYQIIRRSYDQKHALLPNVDVIALQLLRHNYSFENPYLENNVNPIIPLPEHIALSVSSSTDKEATLVGNPTAEQKLYINKKSNDKTGVVNWWALLLQTIGIILLLLFFNKIALVIVANRSPIDSLLFMATSFSIVLISILCFKLPYSLYNIPIFNPENTSSNSIFDSVGELFIIVTFMFWVSVFLYRNIPLHANKNWSPPLKVLTYIGLLSSTFLFTAFIFTLIKILIIDFDVNFSLENLIYSNNKTALGLLCLLFLLVSFFLISQKTAVVINDLQLSNNLKLGGLGIVLLLYGTVLWFIGFEYQYLFVIAWLLIFILLIHNFSKTYTNTILVRSLFSWIFLFSMLASVLIFSYQSEKELSNRIKFAEKKAIQEDRLMEFWFNSKAPLISTDPVVARYFQWPPSPMYNDAELIKRVKKKYLGENFERYKVSMYPFLYPKNEIIRERGKSLTFSEANRKINQNSIHTDNDYLYHIPNDLGGYSYFAKIPVFGEVSIKGYLVIEMEPKIDGQAGVYPELIIDNKYRQPEAYSDYSYAVYNDDFLESYKGNFPYSSIKDSVFVINYDSVFIKHNNYDHFIYKADNSQKTIIVSKANNQLFNLLSLFAYLLCFVLFCVLVVISFNSIFNSENNQVQLRDLLYSSLKKRINASMLMLILVSFLVIGAVTVWYFYARSTNNHRQQLLSKQSEIRASIDQMIDMTLKQKNMPMFTQEQGTSMDKERLTKTDILLNKEEMYQIVLSLSKIHNIDINLFNQDGLLITSSLPDIFDKGLLATQMNPVALYDFKYLSKNQVIQNEEIGSLSYLSAYVPIRSDNLNQAYLNLPYYAREKAFSRELSTFLVALINVYVFFFIGGALLAIFISNSITNPLRMISNKLKEVKLGEQNEMLFWPDNDEIGQLVDQYNRTILELDKSAKLLAKSERELAWQQMARQVAHEIKNPLTPMKLSIQHLQRATHDNHPRLKDLTQRVARTLIEQIDTLSNIANEFSNFAKMPKPNNKLINLRTIVEDVFNLYEDTKTVSMNCHLPETEVFVFADKRQLIRVFNNLIKNAIQSIPEEREGRVNINMRQNSETVLVAVTDNGCGISESKREKVFAPNFTTKNSGMGLGLAMSRNIIEMAQGNIWFESVEDEGTTFFVKLPLATQLAEQLA